MKFDQTVITSYIQKAMPTAITADQVALIKAQVEQVHAYLSNEHMSHQQKLENQLIVESLETQFLQDMEDEKHYQETFLASIEDLDRDYESQNKACNEVQALIFDKKRALSEIEVARFSASTGALIDGLTNLGHGISGEDVKTVVNLGETKKKSTQELKLIQEIAQLEAQYQPLHEKLCELAGLKGKRDRQKKLHIERLKRISYMGSQLSWLGEWGETNNETYSKGKKELLPDHRKTLEARLQEMHSEMAANIPLFSKVAITQSWLEAAQSLEMKKALLALQKLYKFESLKSELEATLRLLDRSIAKTEYAEHEIDRLTQEIGRVDEEKSLIVGQKKWTSRLQTVENSINYVWWTALIATLVLAGPALALPTLTFAAAALAGAVSLLIAQGLWNTVNNARYNREKNEKYSELKLGDQYRSLGSERQQLSNDKAKSQQAIHDLQSKRDHLQEALAKLDAEYQQLEQSLTTSESVALTTSDDVSQQSSQGLSNFSFFSCQSDEDDAEPEQVAALTL